MTLHNSLLEVLVVAGMNEATGLVPVEPQPTAFFHHENKIFSTAFETQTLAAISDQVATFPTKPDPKDPNYPPATFKEKHKSKVKFDPSIAPETKHAKASKSGRFNTWSAQKTKRRAPIHKFQAKQEGSEHLQRNRSRTSSFRVFDLASRRESTQNLSLTPTELPLGADTINSLMMFCFPDGAYLKDKRTPPSVHYLVLTDIDGNRSYAVCVTAYDQYHVKKCAEEEKWDLTKPDQHEQGQGHDMSLAFVPSCFVAISKIPYMTVLADCLSRLIYRVQANGEEWGHILKEFSLHLSQTPTPPAGSVCMHVPLFQDCEVVLLPPENHGQCVVDIPLYLPFLHLHADQVLLVICAILCQQRIVFLSAHRSLVVLVCESFQNLIYPFKWEFTYVPLLSWSLIELVEAPGTFIMGCHSRDRQYIEKVEGLVLVDLDFGEIKACPTLDLPRIPSAAAHIFLLALQQARRHTDWLGLGRTPTFNQNEARAQEQEARTQINKMLQTMCLELMANLFREVFSHSNREKRFFHREQFMECIEDKDKFFYDTVLQTDLFGEFLKSRLSPNLRCDYWTEFLERTKPYNRNSLPQTLADHRHGHKDVTLGIIHTAAMIQLMNPELSTALRSRPLSPSHRRSQSFSNLSTQSTLLWETTSYTALTLPPFIYGLHNKYSSNCLLEIDNALKTSVTTKTRGVYSYLRGLMLCQQNKYKEALEAFHDVEASDSRIFPVQYVSHILALMSSEDRDIVQKSFLFQKSALFKVASETQTNYPPAKRPIIMELSKLPESDIDDQGFTDLVQLLFDLSTDTETISRLFDALTLGERTVVDPYTFEEFYQSWKENEVSLQQVTIPSARLDPTETLLKVSEMCKCSCGTGRIALTPKRLFFLPEGSRKCREIIQLRHIKKVDVVQQRTLLKPIPALKVYNIDEKVKPFFATLKDCSQEWFLLVSEMWSGKVLAEELRNPNIIHKAMQNVLLVNAFIQSGQSDFSNHRGYEMEEAESLCYYMQRRQQGSTKLPPETREFLQQQLDPSSTEQERTTVEALLYIPGRKSGSSAEHFGPRLWCALASGRVIVYDATSWMMETLRTLSTERLVSLVAVKDRQVWAGCFDSNIYVMDQRTKLCNQTLSDHRDMVTEFTLGENGDSLYSCSINGQILHWDTDTHSVTDEIQLPGNPILRSIHYINQKIWCCTRDELLLLSSNGNTLNKISLDFGPVGNPLQLDCFLLTPQNELWLGLGRQGEVAVYYADSMEQKKIIKMATRGISKMILVNNQVWVGTKDGHLFVFNSFSHQMEQLLYAHGDAVRALMTAQDRYVLSGAGSLDGKISIWRIA